MLTTLELVYRYRQIMGRCEAGDGMDFDDIDTLTAIEAEIPAPPSIDATDWLLDETPTVARAVLRGPRLDDEVHLINLGPAGCVCRHAPYAEEGATVELIVRERAISVSYRFKASVLWLQDDGDDFALGLGFVGVPLQVRHRPSGEMPPGDAGRAAA